MWWDVLSKFPATFKFVHRIPHAFQYDNNTRTIRVGFKVQKTTIIILEREKQLFQHLNRKTAASVPVLIAISWLMGQERIDQYSEKNRHLSQPKCQRVNRGSKSVIDENSKCEFRKLLATDVCQFYKIRKNK